MTPKYRIVSDGKRYKVQKAVPLVGVMGFKEEAHRVDWLDYCTSSKIFFFLKPRPVYFNNIEDAEQAIREELDADLEEEAAEDRWQVIKGVAEIRKS